jgi:hypothetical protein
MAIALSNGGEVYGQKAAWEETRMRVMKRYGTFQLYDRIARSFVPDRLLLLDAPKV